MVKQQFQLLNKSLATPPLDPFHHVMYSSGCKDRVKFTKKYKRGRPGHYWFELVSQEAIQYTNSTLNDPTRRTDFLGYKQAILSKPQHKLHLESAPTRQRGMFKIFQKRVGSAWQL